MRERTSLRPILRLLICWRKKADSGRGKKSNTAIRTVHVPKLRLFSGPSGSGSSGWISYGTRRWRQWVRCSGSRVGGRAGSVGPWEAGLTGASPGSVPGVFPSRHFTSRTGLRCWIHPSYAKWRIGRRRRARVFGLARVKKASPRAAVFRGTGSGEGKPWMFGWIQVRAGRLWQKMGGSNSQRIYIWREATNIAGGFSRACCFRWL